MATYITAADVEGVLGAGWEGSGDKDRAVLEANTWLAAKGITASDPVESEIINAGSLIAQLAAQGKLYADSSTGGSVIRKRVKADTVESETQYSAGTTSVPGQLRLATDMLRPFMSGGTGSTFAVRRA
ncbi:DnaT-like ssDNA-binding protein [uncultured Halomonas sp.]|uniref:DnaT-like ssDNA-binding protein n=1 Tax=uncultured Halomonas sp. TaxID=173971 RepID=UPI00262BF8A1|nr:DnaT-like ssDNA-binding protein [uncultured Halomonas sp.]